MGVLDFLFPPRPDPSLAVLERIANAAERHVRALDRIAANSDNTSLATMQIAQTLGRIADGTASGGMTPEQEAEAAQRLATAGAEMEKARAELQAKLDETPPTS